MPNDIIKLLSNQKLRDTVVKTINKVYDFAGTLHDNPTEDMEDIPEEDLWEEAWWRAEIHGEINKIDNAFEKHVFNKMQKPYCIEPKEILDEFYAMACPGGIGIQEFEFTYFDDLYLYFIHNVNRNFLSYKSSNPFPFFEFMSEESKEDEALLKGIAIGLEGYDKAIKFYQDKLLQLNESISEGDETDEEFDALLKGIEIGLEGADKAIKFIPDKPSQDSTIWQCNNITVYLPGTTFVRTHPRKKKKLLNATIAGFLSKNILNKMEIIIPNVLRTAVMSLNLLNKDVDESFVRENKVVFEQYLNAYLVEPKSNKKNKHTFDKRIHNAVHLLVESDQQTNEAISIALSVASIEALLCKEKDNISEKLSTRVASLLEPNLEFRLKAKKFAKAVYNLRSRALHGEELSVDNCQKKQARHLAAGVLSTILLRKDFKKRLGNNPETFVGLLDDLDNAQYKDGLCDGILESNVNRYWQA